MIRILITRETAAAMDTAQSLFLAARLNKDSGELET